MKSKRISPHSDEMLKAIWEAAYDGMILVNEAGIIVSSNPAGCAIFGYSENELVDQPIDILIPRRSREQHTQLAAGFFSGGASRLMGSKRAITGRHKTGKSIPLEIGLTKFLYKSEKLVLTTLRDISERKKTEKVLVQLAYYDQLTGLANRRYFEKQIQNRLLIAKRYKHEFAIIYMDLNKFKQINDTFGHKAGDAVLKQSAIRIKSALRTSDLLARIGGDEFVAIIEETKSVAECKIVAERIIKAFKKPIDIRKDSYSIGISLGIAMYPNHGEEYDLLVKNADHAMYKAKRDRAGISYYFHE